MMSNWKTIILTIISLVYYSCGVQELDATEYLKYYHENKQSFALKSDEGFKVEYIPADVAIAKNLVTSSNLNQNSELVDMYMFVVLGEKKENIDVHHKSELDIKLVVDDSIINPSSLTNENIGDPKIDRYFVSYYKRELKSASKIYLSMSGQNKIDVTSLVLNQPIIKI